MCSVTACVTADLLPRKNVTQSERYLCRSIGHMCSVTAGVTADLHVTQENCYPEGEMPLQLY